MITITVFGCKSQLQVENPPSKKNSLFILGKTDSQWVDFHNQTNRNKSESLCDPTDWDSPRVTLIDFNKDYQIIQILCNRYAYQSDFVFYAHQKTDLSPEPTLTTLTFDQFQGHQRINLNVLLGAFIDPTSQEITTHQKGRGLGDCGNASVYKWTNQMGGFFYLIEARSKEICDGDIEAPWPIIFKKENPETPPLPKDPSIQ